MAEIINKESGSNRSLNQKPRSRKLSLRVDMTPMVDLGFLLITFFMLTMVLSESKAMKLDKRIDKVKDPVGDCQVIHVLIDSFDRIYTYEGMDLETLKPTSFNDENGIRQQIIAKAKRVKKECGTDKKGNPRPVVCLLKLLPGARYQSMINILDEMNITKTEQYSLQEPSIDEVTQVKEKGKELLN